MNFLKNVRIRSKLFLMLAVPVLGLLFFSLSTVIQKAGQANEMGDLNEISRLSVKISSLVHELQKERGASGGFLASEGKKFLTELSSQRQVTNTKLQELKEFLTDFDDQDLGSELSRTLSQALQNIDQIDGKRNQVGGFSISGEEAIAYYTKMNTSFLNVIATALKIGSNAEVTRLVTSYLNFLQGKERAGIERAVLSGVFAKNQFSDGNFVKFVSLMALQNAYYKVFKTTARREQITFLNDKLGQSVVSKVQSIRDIALKNAQAGDFGIDPTEWFTAITQKINLLKEVENRLSADLQNITAEIESSASTSLYLSLFFSVIIFGIAVLMGRVISRDISNTIIEISRAADDLALGNVHIDVHYESVDELGQLTDSFRRIVNSQNKKVTVAKEIAEGNLKVKIEAASKDDELSKSMETMKQNLILLQDELQNTIQAQKDGELDARCSADKVKGSYADLLTGVNEALDSVIKPIFEGIEIIKDYADGDLEKSMRMLPGQQRLFSDAVNRIQTNIIEVIDEGTAIAKEAAGGNLQIRGEVQKFKGSYRKIISGFNNTLDAVIEPINNLQEVLELVSNGDLTRKMEGNYYGDIARLKNSLNETVESLEETLSQVSLAIEQVANGSSQVSESSQSLSQGATEQASSLEETTASMTEINAQSKQNAGNATQANKISATAKRAAETGNNKMQDMLASMEEINKSSTQISKIIKVIDDIAFQTNLLSLNAAVEAARAGVHGKGFAVVAEEVRNLSKRSAKAAEETTELIEGSVQKVNNGNEIATETAESLRKIIESINGVNDLVEEIASASDEQVRGTDQVSEALNQIDQITQSNTSAAEESAAVSEELSGQATDLQRMISKFKLKGSKGDNVLKKTQNILRKGAMQEINRQGKLSKNSPVEIALDDDAFGSV
jgi:methyl-accepting chemotaxis protein